MGTAADRAWDELRAWMGVLRDLESAAALAGWDAETAMPEGAADGRATVQGTLAALTHRELVRPEVEDALDALAGAADPLRAACVREARWRRERASRVPERLVAELAAAQGRCVAVWRDARPRGDYAAYTPPLRHLLGLVRERAAALADDGDLYDALLADYEPGARAADIGPLLEKLTARVAPLIDSLRDASAGRAPLPGRRWPEEGQRRVSEEILRRVGFDTRTGALAVTAHPMTSMLHRGDVRLSTRFADDGPLESILSTMHEAGHGLYEQGLPADADRTLVFEAPSLGAHESQSRFWENHVGRTAEWWASLEPVLREHLPGAMDGLGADDLHRAATRVGPSVIRTQSDEVTYDLHIVLRFRLERAMVLGDLGVDDLPSAFADGLEELVGVRPATLAEGAMQDIHWAAGLYGYFPTYSLGNLNAAQLAAALERDVGSIGEIVAGGDLSPLLGFMRDRVHRHGHLMDATRLMRTATGGPLEVEPFARHLERTYGTL